MKSNGLYMVFAKNYPNALQKRTHPNNGWNISWHYYHKINDTVVPSIKRSCARDLVLEHKKNAFFTKSDADKILSGAKKRFNIAKIVSVDFIVNNLNKK